MEQPHGVSHMGTHRRPQPNGTHGLVIGGSGMTDAHHNPHFHQSGDHFLNALQLRRNGDVVDFALGQGLIVADKLQIVFLQQMLRHGPLVLFSQERALQVDAHQISAVLLHFLMALELPDAPLGLLPGIRENGALPGGGAPGCHEAADLLQILRRGSIDVHPHRSVGMGIDKAGNQLHSRGIENRSVGSGAVRRKNLQLSCLHAHGSLGKPMVKVDLAVYDIGFFHRSHLSLPDSQHIPSSGSGRPDGLPAWKRGNPRSSRRSLPGGQLPGASPGKPPDGSGGRYKSH